MKYVIFDFNGTILDDVDVSLHALNDCIHKYLKGKPYDLNQYRHVFTFPIKTYYEKIGFVWDKDYNFEEVSNYWFDQYLNYAKDCKAFDGVKDILIKSRELGYKNIIISATQLSTLKVQLKQLGLSDYFDEVLAINNIYAASKIEIAKAWIKDKNPKDCMFIGDSLHDLETAQAMNIENVVLVAKGHQAKDVLLEKWKNVVDDIGQVKL